MNVPDTLPDVGRRARKRPKLRRDITLPRRASETAGRTLPFTDIAEYEAHARETLADAQGATKQALNAVRRADYPSVRELAETYGVRPASGRKFGMGELVELRRRWDVDNPA